MQNLRRMDNVVIGEYYLMKIMDEDVNWMKLTHMLSVLSLHLTPPPFVHLPLLQKNIAFTSPLYILCTIMPQIIPLSTLLLVHTCFEESKPPKWHSGYLLSGGDPGVHTILAYPLRWVHKRGIT